MKATFLLTVCLLLSACGSPSTETSGRGVAVRETGPVARIYPRDGDAREARHGLWRGFDEAGRRRWEVRYTRGNPTGPYREWDGEGRLIATWAYDWDGKLMGSLREIAADGSIARTWDVSPARLPDFDPIGRAAEFLTWAANP